MIINNRISKYFGEDVRLARNPKTYMKQIYGEGIEIKLPGNAETLFIIANELAKEMLDKLEEKGYLNKDIVFQNYNTKEVLTPLLEETIKNSIEEIEKIYGRNKFIGGEIFIIAFEDKNRLLIQIEDNGNGFKEDVILNVGKESLTKRNKNQFKFQNSLKDHLFKMGQLAAVLGWDLVVENKKDSQGAKVSLVLPLKK